MQKSVTVTRVTIRKRNWGPRAWNVGLIAKVYGVSPEKIGGALWFWIEP